MREPIWRRMLRLHGPDPRADVAEEFAFHLEERTESLVARGMSETQAREVALRQFGNLSTAMNTCTTIGSRRVRRGRWQERFESVWQDAGYAAAMMRRSPGFTLAVVLTIALGVGANTAVFSLLNALLLEPLDATHPEELVRIYTSEGHALRTDRDRYGASSYADYRDLAQSRSLAGLAASMPLGASVHLGDTSRRFEGRVVSENYFTVLDRPLMRGGWRSEVTNALPDVIVSHRFWKTVLGEDQSIIGRRIRVNERDMVVAGVTAASFRGIEPANVDLYFSFRSAASLIPVTGFLTDRGDRAIRLLGRLRPGVAPESAEAALSVIMRSLGDEFPGSNANRVVSVRRASSIIPMELFGPAVLPTAALVFAATLVMLAITGINVAAVLMARTIKRRREMAVRLSLGAGPLRLARQLITESVLLALVASVLVIGIVSWIPFLTRAVGVPASILPGVDATVLGYAVLTATLFGILFGLAPALMGIQADVVASLRSGESGARPARARAQRLLVHAQLALSMLLIVVGGALLSSLHRQQQIDPGFPVSRLVVANFEDPSGGVNTEHNRVLNRLTLERLSSIPGVTSASTASMAPLTGDGMRSTTHIPGYFEGQDESMDIQVVTAGPTFFKTLGIPMYRGRELGWDVRDTLPRVVINRAMARQYWGARDPIGSFIRLGGEGGEPAEVIGVSEDARFISLTQEPVPMYVVQRSTEGGETVLVRTSGEASTLMLAVRGAMSRNDVPLSLVQLQTMEDILGTSLIATRAVSATLIAIGLVAILLAAVGLYGVVAYVTAGRTREFGVRRALGATPASITKLVLAFGMRLAVIGSITGVLVGVGALRVIRGMLYGSWSFLPIVSIAALALMSVTLLACLIPALRASATDPASALRTD
jgi:predicted permease